MQDKRVKYIPYTSTRFLVSKYQYIFDQFLLDLFVFKDLHRRKELKVKRIATKT